MRHALHRSVFGWVITLAACQGGGGGRTPVSSEDSAMTARYEALLKEQLTSSDPHAAQVAILCEMDRVMVKYGTHRTRVPFEEAAARALGPETRARVREIDNQLANHVFTAGKGCDSLGRAGVLGGPWPSDSEQTAAAKRDFPP